MGRGNPILVNSQDWLFYLSDYDLRESGNNGSSWGNITWGDRPFSGLAMDSKDVLFLATRNGAHKTTNKGKNWTALSAAGDNRMYGIAVTGQGALLAGTGTGVFRSTDEGVTWDSVSDAPMMEVFTAGDGELVIATSRHHKRLYVSTDDGRSWSVAMELRETLGEKLPVGPGKFLAAGTPGGAYVLDVFQRTLVPSNTGMIRTHIYSLAVPSSQRILAGSNGRIEYLDVGQKRWTAVHIPTGNLVTGLAVSDADHIVAGTHGGGLLYSTDQGESWTPSSVQPSNLQVTCLGRDSSGLIYAGTEGGGVWVTSDRGITWQSAGLEEKEIWSLGFLRSGRMIAGGAAGTCWYSDDKGESWMSSSTDVTSDLQSISSFDDRKVYAATFSHGLLLSTDQGITWGRTAFPDTGIMSVIVESESVIHAGTREGYFLSEDGGETWRRVTEGMTTKAVNAMIMRGNTLYIGAENSGVYQREPAGSVDAKTDRMSGSSILRVLNQHGGSDLVILLDLNESTSLDVGLYDVKGERVATVVRGEEEAGHHSYHFSGSELAGGVYWCIARTSVGTVTQSVYIPE